MTLPSQTFRPHAPCFSAQRRPAILPFCATVLLCAALAGCGGGGSTGSPNKTLVGTLLGVGSVPLAGDTVIYDSGTAGQQTTVTNQGGVYKFVLPLNTITGADTLTITDAAGHLLDMVSITLVKNKNAVTITNVIPPPPPGL